MGLYKLLHGAIDPYINKSFRVIFFEMRYFYTTGEKMTILSLTLKIWHKGEVPA